MFILGLGGFGFSAFWAFETASVPLVLGNLTDSARIIGLVLSSAGLFRILLPPLVGAWSDRVRTPWGRRRPFLLLATPFIAATTLLLPGAGSLTAAAALLIAMFISIIIAQVPFQALMPELIAPEKRATANGVGNLVGAVANLTYFVAGGLLWDRSPWLAAGVIAASLLLSAGVVGFGLREVPAPAREVAAREAGPREAAPRGATAGRPAEARSLRAWWRDWHMTRDFAFFIMAQVFWRAGFWALASFFVLYVTRTFGLSGGRATMILGFMVVGGAAFAIPVGVLADRFGHKRIATAGLLLFACVALAGFLARSLTAVYVVAAVGGAAFAVLMVVPYAIMLNLAPEERLSRFIGISNSTEAVGQAVAPVVAGAAADVFGLRTVFLVSAAGFLLGTILLQAVRERK